MTGYSKSDQVGAAKKKAARSSSARREKGITQADAMAYRAKAIRDIESIMALGTDLSPDEGERLRRLARARLLPEERVELVAAKSAEGKSTREIAAEVGVSHVQVQHDLRKAVSSNGPDPSVNKAADRKVVSTPPSDPPWSDESKDRVAVAKLLRDWSATWSTMLDATNKLVPSEVVPRIEPGSRAALQMQIESLRGWLDAIDQELGAGSLRAVNGGKQ